MSTSPTYNTILGETTRMQIVGNQRIESWWSQFQRSNSNWRINYFKDMQWPSILLYLFVASGTKWNYQFMEQSSYKNSEEQGMSFTTSVSDIWSSRALRDGKITRFKQFDGSKSFFTGTVIFWFFSRILELSASSIMRQYNLQIPKSNSQAWHLYKTLINQ